MARHPDLPAISWAGNELSYADLNRRANQLAHRLIRRGVRPDVLVGVFADRSIEQVVGVLAVLKAGGAYLPMDTAYPRDRLTFMMEDAKVPLVLTQHSAEGRLPPHHADVLFLEPDVASESGEDGQDPQITVEPDHLAYVIYTSGSTGRPKGVMVSHHNVVRLMRATEPWFSFDRNDVWTLFHSYSFDFSVWEMWGALLYGGRLVVVSREMSRDPSNFYDLLVREGVTVLNQTPSAFQQLIQAEENRRDIGNLDLRLVIFGGEALELPTLRRWIQRHGDETPRLVNMYGVTETTVHVTYRRILAEDIETGKGSVIGAPISDLRVYVLDQRLQPVPVGVLGELFVGGPGLARGYLNRPDLTEADRDARGPESSR